MSLARLAAALLLAAAAWHAVDSFSGVEPGPDSSAFMAVAEHLRAGRALYREVWDHKPPAVHLLDAAALAFGADGVNSVRNMERVFAVLGTAALVGVAFLAFGSWWLAFAAGVPFLLHFYALETLEQGNVTEEYGAVFALAGMGAALLATRGPDRRAAPLATLAGAAFAAAALCKEPYVLLAPPWLAALCWGHDRRWAPAARRAGFFALGAAVPALLFVAWLLRHGAWADWVDVVAFNLGNTSGRPAPLRDLVAAADAKVFRQLLVTRVAALLGLAHAAWWLRARRGAGAPVAIAASAALGLVAASIGGRLYGHYFLFLVPSYVLLAASGVAFVAGLRQRAARAALAAALLAATAFDGAALGAFARRLAEPARRWPGHHLSATIRENTASEEPIWAPFKPLLYAESGRLSPTKWPFVFDHLFVDTPAASAEAKYEALRRDLRAHPPALIVLNAPPGWGYTRAAADAFLARSGLAPWIDANFRTVIGSPGDPFEVLAAKGSLRGTAPGSGDAAELMQEGLDALYAERNPIRAVLRFQRVLDVAPTHYGAHFQLAKALDAAGQRVEARRAWTTMHALALQAGDAPSLEAARRRLRAPAAETPEEWMAAGLSCLYVLDDAPAAAGLFRKVLGANPGHYGANFQLAKALDAAGAAGEAAGQWRRVLGLAEAAQDAGTAATARARLATGANPLPPPFEKGERGGSSGTRP